MKHACATARSSPAASASAIAWRQSAMASAVRPAAIEVHRVRPAALVVGQAAEVVEHRRLAVQVAELLVERERAARVDRAYRAYLAAPALKSTTEGKRIGLD